MIINILIYTNMVLKLLNQKKYLFIACPLLAVLLYYCVLSELPKVDNFSIDKSNYFTDSSAFLSDKSIYLDAEFYCQHKGVEEIMLISRIPFKIKKGNNGLYVFDDKINTKHLKDKGIKFDIYELSVKPYIAYFHCSNQATHMNVEINYYIHTDTKSPNQYGRMDSKIGLDIVQTHDTVRIIATLYEENRLENPSIKRNKNGILSIFRKKHAFKDWIIKYNVNVNEDDFLMAGNFPSSLVFSTNEI